MNAPDPKANTTTEAYLAYKAGYLEESELKPVLYEPYLHFDGWLAYWAGLVDYFPVKRSEEGKNLMPILPGKISYRGLDITVGEDGTITLNGHTTGAVTIKLSNGLEESSYVSTAWVNQDITDDVDGKCISLRYVSGSAPASATALRLYGSSGSAAITQWYFQSNDQNTVFSTTSKASCLVIYANQNLVFNNYKFRVQLEDNPAPTDYMPYASVPEMLCDEEALVAYLAGVTDTYPEEIKDPYDVRIVGYLKYLVSYRFGRPEYPVNNEEFYLSTMDAPHTSNETPSSDIELDTSAGKIIDVKAYGDTFQQTYSGANLYDYADTTLVNPNITVGSDGWVTATYDNSAGSSTVYIQYYTNALPLSTDTNYNVVLEVQSKSGSGFLAPVTGHNSGQFTADWTNTIADLTANTTYTHISKTKADFTDVTHSLRTLLIFNAGQSGSVTFRLSLLADTTVTPQTFVYQPYTGGIPSPNPEYPQSVNVVTGTQTVNVHGKNLFDIQDATGTRGNNTVIAKDQSITVDSNTNGTETTFYLNNCSYISQYLPTSYSNARDFKMTGFGGNYTIKIYYENIPSGTGAINTVTYTNKQTILKNRASIINGVVEISIELDNDEYIKSVAVYTANTNVFSNFTIKAQLEQGSTPTTYEPYTSQTFTIDLGSIELTKIGTYQDYIYKSGDDWYVHKEIGKGILTGTTPGMTVAQQTGDGRFNIVLPTTWEGYKKSDNDILSFCNSYQQVGQTAYNTSFDPLVANMSYALNFNSGGGNALRVKNIDASTVQEMKDSMDATNLILYYQLATATDTQITDSTLIAQLNALAGADTYNEKTFIKVTANDPNLPALLKVEAYKY